MTHSIRKCDSCSRKNKNLSINPSKDSSPFFPFSSFPADCPCLTKRRVTYPMLRIHVKWGHVLSKRYSTEKNVSERDIFIATWLSFQDPERAEKKSCMDKYIHVCKTMFVGRDDDRIDRFARHMLVWPGLNIALGPDTVMRVRSSRFSLAWVISESR